MSDITIRDGGDGFIYADAFGFEPNKELYIELRSAAIPPNDSTEGVSAALHKTVGVTGTVHFKAPKDYLLPDLPREITVIGPIATETFTA